MNQMKNNTFIPVYIHLAVYKRVIMTAIIIWFVITGCGCKNNETQEKHQNIPAVQVESVSLKTITKSIALTGTIEAAKVARIASPAEGPILHCPIREGDIVKQGQVLITLGRKLAAEELVKAAREELNREEDDLKRIEQLVDSGAIPSERKDEAQLKVIWARAKLSKALENIEDYQVLAPWEGIVSKVFVTDGYFVSPRETLVEIFDPHSLVIMFSVPEKESKNVSVGMQFKVIIDAYGDRIFNAKITRCYPELDRNMHTRIVEAALTENISLLPGMFARIDLPVQSFEDAIVIPDASVVMTSQGETVVFIVKEGKALRRVVKLGIEQGQSVQITDGLEVGASVVVSGNQRLQNHMEVLILENNKNERAIE